MNYNYSQPQQMYGMQNRQTYNPTNIWSARIRPVSSFDEVKAATIDFDGSVFFFPDLANKRIYTKQFNLDGTCSTNMYELKEIPVSSPEPGATIDTANFITRAEFETAIGQIRQILTQPIQENVEQLISEEKPAQNFVF